MLSQRLEGPSRGRRRRGETRQDVGADLDNGNKESDVILEKPPRDSFQQLDPHPLNEHESLGSSAIAAGLPGGHNSVLESAAQLSSSPPELKEDNNVPLGLDCDKNAAISHLQQVTNCPEYEVTPENEEEYLHGAEGEIPNAFDAAGPPATDSGYGSMGRSQENRKHEEQQCVTDLRTY